MLLPPHLTSYGNNNSSPLLGRDGMVEQRGSVSSLMAPSLSYSVAKKHSLRGGPHVVPIMPNEDPIDEEDEEDLEEIDPESIPESLSETERTNNLVPIRVFGEEMVACVLSVKIKCRERGLDHVGARVARAREMAEDQRLDCIAQLMKDPEDLSADDSSVGSGGADDLDPDTHAVVLFVRATLMMLQEAVMDSRESVIQSTISIWQDVSCKF